MARYDLSDEQYERLMKASQPVAMIALQCGPISSPQENANAAWRAVAKEHGCDFATIQPYPGNPRSFTAEPILKEAASITSTPTPEPNHE